MSAVIRIGRDPWATARRLALVVVLAALIVFVGALIVVSEDGPLWIIYALALVVGGLAVMQVLAPGAGIRVPRLRRRSDGRDFDALVAAALAAGWHVRERNRERTERLFDVEEPKPIAWHLAVSEALRRTRREMPREEGESAGTSEGWAASRLPLFEAFLRQHGEVPEDKYLREYVLTRMVEDYSGTTYSILLGRIASAAALASAIEALDDEDLASIGREAAERLFPEGSRAESRAESG